MNAKKRSAPASSTAFQERVRIQAAPRRRPSGIIPLADCHGMSEKGRRREANEDSLLMTALSTNPDSGFDQEPEGKLLGPSPGQTGLLFLVADGVGGVPCGERASSIAVRSLHRSLQDQPGLLEKGSLEITRALRLGMRHCEDDLRTQLQTHPECEGMSTTLTGILSVARRLFVVHAGDSRCYMLRGSQFTLVTHDHTQSQMNLEAGVGEASRKAPGGNHLWNYLTSDCSGERVDVDLWLLEPGDILLLCTDGLSDALPAEEIQRHLSSKASARDIVQGLLAAARGRGDGDDLTVVVGRFANSP